MAVRGWVVAKAASRTTHKKNGPEIFSGPSKLLLLVFSVFEMDFYDFVGEFCDGWGLVFELVEEFIDRSVIDRAVILITDLEERGSVAGVEAFDFVEGEDAIGCCFAIFDSQFLFEVVANAVRAAHMACEAGADLDHMFADCMIGVVHAIECGNPFYFGV